MNSIILFFFLFFCFVLPVSFAQEPSRGKCPDVKVQSDFDPTKYFGKWYEITKYKAAFESGQKCNSAEYTPKDNGHFTVFNRGFQNGKYVNATGDAYSPDPDVPAKIKVKFSELSPYGDYWVLDTDYNTYTLIYSCIGIASIEKLEFAWILARQPSLDDAIRQKLYKKMESFGIDPSKLKDDDQTNCRKI